MVDGDPAPLTLADLDAPRLAVLTGCAVAVATTGTGPRRLDVVICG